MLTNGFPFSRATLCTSPGWRFSAFYVLAILTVRIALTTGERETFVIPRAAIFNLFQLVARIIAKILRRQIAFDLRRSIHAGQLYVCLVVANCFNFVL